MCVLSMVLDHYNEKWREYIHPPTTPISPFLVHPVAIPISPITKEEIEEFRKLLERARKYDKEHNQPDCELEEKKNKVRKLAEELGVKIDFL